MHDFVLVPEGPSDYLSLRGIIATTLTSESWEADETESLCCSLGVFPTVNSHVSTVLDLFSHLPVQLIPIVDGDNEGDAKITELIKQAKSKTVLQLPKDWTLENLISWLLDPLSDTAWNCLLSLLKVSALQYSTEALHRLLTHQLGGDTFKTRWDLLQDLGFLIGQSEKGSKKAKSLIVATANLLSGKQQTLWSRDSARSTASIGVFCFSPENCTS